MSGLIGVFNFDEEDVFSSIYYGLYALQHRGQEAAGIGTIARDKVQAHTGKGLVSENFGVGLIDDMPGDKGIGFVQYKNRPDEISEMPLVKGNSLLAIDGVIYNEDFNTDTFFDYLNGDIFQLTEYISTLQGKFAFIFMNEERFIAHRNQDGVKPLAIGKVGSSTVITSETCAIDSLEGHVIREFQPGELFVKTPETRTSYYITADYVNTGHIDAFEFTYTARPDSIIDGVSVYQARYRLGEALYRENPAEKGVVIGAPDSGVIAALGFANASKLPYQEGFVRNRYIGRTFIKTTPLEREQGVQIKLTPIQQNVSNQDIILVDDSIVRGTTIKRTVESLKNSGARSVHVRIASPPVVASENVTIAIPDEEELIAYNYSVEEMVDIIGCDSLAYLSLEGFHQAIGRDYLYEDYFVKK